jgi:ribosomal-protein-serine acetyltransferase
MRTWFLFENIRLEALSEAHLEEYWQSIERSRSQIESWLGTFFSPTTENETRTFLQDRCSDWQKGNGCYFAIFQNTDFIGLGFVNTINLRHRFANLGYWVDSTQTGRGYATKIARGLASFAFEDLVLYRVELVIDVNNIASQKVAEKAGALYEGTLRNRLQLDEKPCNASMYSLVP